MIGAVRDARVACSWISCMWLHAQRVLVLHVRCPYKAHNVGHHNLP